ncbi:sugar transferase [Streptomyces diastatochromogenes]|uniref:Exopolysaccharide biosynthesis polyprenyl glycosylphosphotransferase n=1 Tax=Streptomyces diastatochromogenes TaxID=42236 RepID=A0A233SAY8_STRDA|nr:sugar transferase [Streptomyces diastatochromogenes]MCZ0985335.1 sugar transferase [Streptomyces diastatochromogenes]OXY92828.1 exopolysaccharide biosynthesis polyprenyl glycosylphosphotransferase [Streptomyces diastatochromogenes]
MTIEVTHEHLVVERRSPRVRRRRWEQRYRLVLLVADGSAAAVAAFVIHAAYGRWAVALVLPPTWIVAMLAHRSYDRSTLGLGTEEYRRVLRGAVALPALAAGAYYLFTHDSGLFHDMIMATVPAVAIALSGRYLLRRRMHRRWARGRDRSATLLVGPSHGIVELVTVLRRGGAQELQVAGVCLSDPENATEIRKLGLPLLGGVDDMADVFRALGISTVAVLPAPEFDASVLRRMSWIAAVQEVDFLLAPVLTDVSASRLAVRPTNGIPLVGIQAPNLSRISRVPKELLDRSLAAVLLVFLALPMLLIALIVRLDSSGPALFRQQRVGRYGDHFTMLKFRTMRQDSETLRAELAHLNQNSDGLLFKVKEDPRITRVGSFLRRSSLDELPQLINAVRGTMSLVGPRPPLPEEVDEYTPDIKRRLLVKPGLTGLWQVSGRSDLPWDEAVRLDLGYVDNWSMGLDLSILLRTGSVVVRRTGAY